MKALLVFYSKSGHTARVASMIESELTSRGVEVHSVRASRQKEATFWGSATEARRLAKPELSGPLPDADEYDLVIIGCPIWAGHAASPANSILANLSGLGPNKKCAIFACSGFAKGFERGLEQVAGELKARGATLLAARGFPMGNDRRAPEDASAYAAQLMAQFVTP